MSILAPAWAWLAGAIDSAGDSHLPPGVHVRCLPSPPLGLPATPLMVTRTVLDPDLLAKLARSDGVTWIDSHGATLTAPFTVTPDNPVTGYFSELDVVWAQLAMRQVSRLGGLQFDALQDTEFGPAPFQSASQQPYALCHWFLGRVRVSGSGLVTGIRWLDATAINRNTGERFWEWWSLPVAPAPRYIPPPDAADQAKLRVQRGAVLRQPMHVAYTAAGPTIAPAAGPADAFKRLDQVRNQLDQRLKRLLQDLSQPTWALREEHAIAGQAGKAQPGSVGLGIENFLLLGSIDPDIGHYLGLGDVDRDLDAKPGALVLYRMRGLFRWNANIWSPFQSISFAGALRFGRADAIAQFPELTQYKLEPHDDIAYLDLHQYAVAVVRQPPQGMTAPQIAACDDRGWLSTPPPPNVRRALRLVATGFPAPALAAVVARDKFGTRSLHAWPDGARWGFGAGSAPPGLPLSWVVSRSEDPQQADEARLEDRNAPDGPVEYSLAKGDWFGRWSPWALRTAPDRDRTPPMRPALLMFVTPPQLAPPPVAPPSGLLSGTIELRIPLPHGDELPPGGAPLDGLLLIETFGANPDVSLYLTLAGLPATARLELDPSSQPGHAKQQLIITRTGPALYPAQQIKVSYTARWRDALAHQSALAFPAKKTIIDPRPPAAPVIIRPLAYTSRPDAMGHARVAFSFDGQDGVGYRVYTSNESTLLKALDGFNAPLAANIRNTALINDRAGALVDHRGLFGWDHFELITEHPLYRDPASGKVSFTHRLSAGLSVAVFYRVVAEGPGGGLSELSASSMFAFGVPNIGGPGQPLVSVVNVPEQNPVEHGVVLRVKVPHGASAPRAWRLRRTSTAGADPLRMPTVLEGTLSSALHVQNVSADTEGDSFDIIASAPLRPWVNYRFVVEVQGESPPGADTVLVPGEWGDASGPVKFAAVPAGPPPAVPQVQLNPDAGGLHIAITPPAAVSLQSTMMGNFSFEAWRIEPGKRPRRLDQPFVYDAASQRWQAFDATPVAAGALTTVSVRVIDPLGRSSEATLSNTV
jgi:hypothetical protein